MLKRTEKNMRPRGKTRPNMKCLSVKITKPNKIRITPGPPPKNSRVGGRGGGAGAAGVNVCLRSTNLHPLSRCNSVFLTWLTSLTTAHRCKVRDKASGLNPHMNVLFRDHHWVWCPGRRRTTRDKSKAMIVFIMSHIIYIVSYSFITVNDLLELFR